MNTATTEINFMRVRDLRSITDAQLALAVNSLGEWLSQVRPTHDEYEARDARFTLLSTEQNRRIARDEHHRRFLADA
jgi:hypothetical protein